MQTEQGQIEPKQIESIEYDESGQNRPNRTEMDKIGSNGPNRNKMD